MTTITVRNAVTEIITDGELLAPESRDPEFTVSINSKEARMIRLALELAIDVAEKRGRNSRVIELDNLQTKFYPGGF